MRIQCGGPGIATIAMWAAQAPKKLLRSTKPLTRRKVTWKGTTLQIIVCEGTHFAFWSFWRSPVSKFIMRSRSLTAFAVSARTTVKSSASQSGIFFRMASTSASDWSPSRLFWNSPSYRKYQRRILANCIDSRNRTSEALASSWHNTGEDLVGRSS